MATLKRIETVFYIFVIYIYIFLCNAKEYTNAVQRDDLFSFIVP